MTRDYWLYQEREVQEPWAAHVYVIGATHIDIRFYAEYLPAKCSNYLGVGCDYASFLDAFERFAEEHGQDLTVDDVQQVNRLWLAITNDLGLII